MNRLYKPILIITWLLLLGAFTSTSLGQTSVTPSDTKSRISQSSAILPSGPPTPTPADVSTGVSQGTSTVSWSAFADPLAFLAPAKYDVEFNGTDGSYASFVTKSSDQSGTSFAFGGPALLYKTTYYWRVRDNEVNISFPALNTPGVWYTFSFTTVLATPVNATPGSGSSALFSALTTFVWTMDPSYSNVEFEAKVASNVGLTTDVQTSTVAGVLTTGIAIPFGGVYYWNVKATVVDGGADNNGETKTSGTTSFTLTLLPPSLTAPVNGLTGVSIEPTFTWGSVLGAKSYRLFVDDDADVLSPFYDLDQGTDLTKALKEIDAGFPLENNTKYYWKVAAVDNDGTEYPSSIYHFTTYPDLNPLLLWPTDGLTISGDNITFSWLISTPIGALKFYLQYIQQTAAPDSLDWAGSSTTLSGTSNLFTTLSLTGGLDYHWRVIVKDGSDIVDYSVVNSFTTNGGTSVTITPTWPTGGVTVYTNNPTLNWYPSLYVPGLLYQVRYALTSSVDGDGALNHFSAANLALTSNLFTTFAFDLTPGTEYFWQARVKDPSTGLFGPYSTPTNFVTNGSGTLVVPVPSYPLGGVTVYTTQPTLSWYIGTSGLGLVYDVEIKESTVDFNGTPTHNDVTTLFKLSDPLTPGKSYHWRVRSDNGTTESAWSTLVVSGGAEFTVSGGITAALPIAIWPVGNVSILSTTPTLSWTVPGSVLGITGYTVKYKKDSAPTWSSFSPGAPDETDGEIAVSGGTTLFKLLTTPLDYGGHYYWAVASVDATGESAYSEGEFTITGGTSSGTPTLLFPADASTVYNKKPTFSWYVSGSPNGITGYELVYSTSDVFAAPVTTTETPTVTSFTPSSDLTPGSNYYWKVKSTYATLPASSFSPVFVFTVNPGAAPIQPILGGPTDNLVVPTSEPTLAWKVNAEPNASMTYELELADNENMQNSSVISDITTTYQKVSGLHNDQNYYWRVRSKNADGSYSEYSGMGKFYAKFSVTAVDNELVIPQKFTVEQNYPNPFNPTTTIRFALPEASFVILKIYNMLGQEVKTLVNGQRNAGTYNVQWKGDNDFGQKVSSGTYIYRVIAGANIFTKKMILLK